jgi:aminoglycoside 6'-N-acetyltransferase
VPERPLVELRPATPDDVDDFVAIVSGSEWWGYVSGDDQLRADLLDDECTVYAIVAGGATVGWLQVYEENEPGYRYAALDIMLAPSHQDRGIGPEALRQAIEGLIAAGHHRFTIDPALNNERAIRAYEKVGFRRVGVLRQYWRDSAGEWRDGLLMELLAGDLAAE